MAQSQVCNFTLADFLIPESLQNGRYTEFKPINKGSFGVVFEAYDMEREQKVAIKGMMLDPQKDIAKKLGLQTLGETSEELDIHSKVGYHPNVVQFIDSFKTERYLFVVLELCSHGDLYDFLKDNNDLSTEAIRKLILQLIDGVKYLHSRGVYHRDLKPENLFLDDHWNLKIGDLGLATTNQFPADASVGSDRYMSEQQYDPVDGYYSAAAADVWSIGICILNIVFGRSPFEKPCVEKDGCYNGFVRNPMSLTDIYSDMTPDCYNLVRHALHPTESFRDILKLEWAVEHIDSFTNDQVNLGEVCEISQFQDSGFASSNDLPSSGDFSNGLDIPKVSASVPNRVYSSFLKIKPAGLSQSWADMCDDDDEEMQTAPALSPVLSSSAIVDEDGDDDDVSIFPLEGISGPTSSVPSGSEQDEPRTPQSSGRSTDVLSIPPVDTTSRGGRSPSELARWTMLGDGRRSKAATSPIADGKIGAPIVLPRRMPVIDSGRPLQARKSPRRSDYDRESGEKWRLSTDWRQRPQNVSPAPGPVAPPAPKRVRGANGADNNGFNTLIPVPAMDLRSGDLASGIRSFATAAGSGLSKLTVPLKEMRAAPIIAQSKVEVASFQSYDYTTSLPKTNRRGSSSRQRLRRWQCDTTSDVSLVPAPRSPAAHFAGLGRKTIFQNLGCRELPASGASRGFGLTACV